MYKYSLHKKSIKHRCPNCEKNRFVRYVNNETGEYLAEKVGRCDREINCGYHYKPKQYFQDNNIEYTSNWNRQKVIIKQPISFHQNKLMKETLKDYENNNFINSLKNKFSDNEINRVIDNYKIGTADFWYNSTIFWQIDFQNKIRGGKIISYKKNGKRTKYINWVHSYLIKYKNLKQFNLKQCLFGEHLINKTNKMIAIVESEKTACIMSILFDKYLWLATGSLSGLNYEKLKVIKNRKIVLYPDLGNNSNKKTPYDLWKNKCSEFKKLGFDISISDLLEKKSTKKQQEKGLDIADYFMQNKRNTTAIVRTKNEKTLSILQNKNNKLKLLIKRFNLKME